MKNGTLTAIIETPKGSSQKYDYDEKTDKFKLNKILPSGMVFPYDFGFIPKTKGQDGDPLDIIIISEFGSFPGCLIPCRVLGSMRAVQSEEAGHKKMIRNDRYIAVPEEAEMYDGIKTVSHFPPKILKEIEDFFIQYNKLQGKKFVLEEQIEADEAIKMIESNKKKSQNGNSKK
ncbi:MAG: inorganic pyrophosphatase [Bacteroidetes bacterium]|nr:MAG: inorganic pyrophosphatase [Bacteroidota bacterium]